MPSSDAFSSDYLTARSRFREAAKVLGWSIESIPLGGAGPNGETLTLDAACSPRTSSGPVLILSSGLHGIEGFFGSAVQVALLEHWADFGPPPVGCLLLHALNPYGFAWRRRFDENNVDPNRNFLLAGQPYEGAPPGYSRLDPLLNPQRPPSRWEPFLCQALWAIVRQGMPALRQTIAGGQFAFPQGLFYGGGEPTALHGLLREHLSRWLRDATRVMHLDFHTGLGRRDAWKLLVDYPLDDADRRCLTDVFGADAFSESAASGIAYEARGGLGAWCVAQGLAPEYRYLCAEFGTYGPLAVLAGLRAENQAHHFGQPGSASTERVKRRLAELFCPADPAWRARVLEQSQLLVDQAIAGLQ
ncbi:DUF2817 domain-containing protein [Lignipirellula cremea]|uniref:DUF2817 domain-containing protein n=1 Tax=Lignipirellula cremea TaxID=2528010 RepID=A0A518DZE5_9BACT|nr:DUF2817 domain-containing protein [Lignipirellula cremea]QDU97214.1 hypothetical protein Pla8534_50590 [Lignipirellula cremea]